MAMFHDAPQRPELYQRFERETPDWYRTARFGVFIHWGAYSVPAWAEPIGELGTIERRTWFAHNPYAEWYFNTIRIEGSPARQHQDEVWGGAPYDDFLDRWGAEEFDPADWAALFRRAGARYVIPTTKHHDGIALWDAPGTGDRNTVRRGPRRDLVGDIGAAVRDAGMRFGVYYSGGLDWHASPHPPIEDEDFSAAFRPVDEEYTAYANAHVRDLVDRYRPDVLWGDIEWPDAGKPDGPLSFAHVLEQYYAAVPDGVVNDRWGLTHWDFRTSEYQQGRDNESSEMWENCRGVGFSFGYNQVETADHYMDGPAATRHLLDVVSRGGNFLLNVGPDAAGRIPELQRRTLDQLGDWMEAHPGVLDAADRVAEDLARPGDDPWVRWLHAGDALRAVVQGEGPVHLDVAAERVRPEDARSLDGTPLDARVEDGGVRLTLPPARVAGPSVVELPLR